MAKEKNISVDNDKLKAVDAIVKSLQTKFGKENVNYLGNKEVESIERLRSGCSSLDNALGGGWPLGRMVELFGGESSGKSTICYHAMAEAQKMGYIVGLIDVEYSHDPVYSGNIGVKNDALIVSQPEDGTQAMEILLGMLDSGVKVIVVDSIAALLPKEEAECEDMSKATVGRQAQLMSRALRKIAPAVGRNNALVMFTNQTRQKIGVLYGNPLTTPGGESMKYYASIRCQVTAISGTTSNEDGEITSRRTKVKVVKNKTAPPFRECEFNICFGSGIDEKTDIIENAIELLFEKRPGGVYVSELLTEKGEEKIRGRENLINWIKDQGEEYLEYLKQKMNELKNKNEEMKNNENQEDITSQEI